MNKLQVKYFGLFFYRYFLKRNRHSEHNLAKSAWEIFRFRFLFVFKGFYAIEIFKSVKKFQILGPKNETLSEP